jgi:predicted Kef-type K+ transport protein
LKQRASYFGRPAPEIVLAAGIVFGALTMASTVVLVWCLTRRSPVMADGGAGVGTPLV